MLDTCVIIGTEIVQVDNIFLFDGRLYVGDLDF